LTHAIIQVQNSQYVCDYVGIIAVATTIRVSCFLVSFHYFLKAQHLAAGRRSVFNRQMAPALQFCHWHCSQSVN